MAENLTPVQLHDLAVTLENEQAFYNVYRSEDPGCARARPHRSHALLRRQQAGGEVDIPEELT